MNLIALLNNSEIEVVVSKAKYIVHYLCVSHMFEFEHMGMHSANSLEFENTTLDKVYSLAKVESMLFHKTIRVTKIQSFQIEKITEIHL